MKPEDLFVTDPNSDPEYPRQLLDRTLVDRLKTGPMFKYRDEDVAYQLLTLLGAEIPQGDYGKLTDQGVADAMRCLDAVLTRLDIDFHPPFRTRPGYDRWMSDNNHHLHITEEFEPLLSRLARHEGATAKAGYRGVQGDLRTLIFASKYKPDLVWVDFAQGIVEITKNASQYLMYNRPISTAGMTMGTLADWWRHRDGIYSLPPAEQLRRLHDRFAQHLGSDEERQLLTAYWKFAEKVGFEAAPAILPQVWLHYDPITQGERDADGGRVLVRQRMDFLLLPPGGRRIVLEVDGIQHYSENGWAVTKKYAQMVKEDRRIRLQGYEVHRFGTYEFKAEEAPAAMLADYFAELLKP
ncbi:hypothetical protein [Streptomyces goshikiensis]|uniref:hypothetical protein n=1 Tax=Streptomyces goshikiensis TaxID=1942 RepID=UPI0036A1DA19